MIGFAACSAALTCVAFGFVPALISSQTNPGSVIKSGGRTATASSSQTWFQNALIVGQVAISIVLLIGAVLFIRSFRNLATLDLGFHEKGVVVAELDLSQLPQLTEARAALHVRDLVEQISALPDVQAASTTTHIPLDGGSWTLGFRLPNVRGESKFTWASPRYFETLGEPILAGREFNDRDTPSSPRVAVVNQTFVRRFFSGQNPLGRTLQTIAEPNYPATEYEIIGIVRDAKYAYLREQIPPQVFGSAPQVTVPDGLSLAIRSSAHLAAVITRVRQKLSEVSPAIGADFHVLETERQDKIVRERLMAVLAGFFGAVSLALAGIGLYGLMAYSVAARRNDIGVRLALGATRRSVIKVFLLRALALLLSGVALGGLLALVAVASARSLLFGVNPESPIIFAAVSIFLLAIALLASFVPVFRASGLDPVETLRYE